MALVSVHINGHSYTVGCENGQERHVQAMAHQVERRVQQVRNLGFSGESRLLVLAALLMADEIQDLSGNRVPESTILAAQDAERLRAELALTNHRLADLADTAESLAVEIERAYIEKAELPDT
ncbi:cell division protein ZapA [Acetobacter okinawensis]|uniref:Cell division protein ZapA n=1 Tax=Acetobacter okinawensis TaxID=1076594 RepID=A0A252BYH5_9PROT|nr:cell division protein ZapA [Acetobacter okinawensis]